MAKNDKPKEYEFDAQFPDNVDPSDENRRKFTEQRKKEQREAAKAAREAEDE